jgi:RNA polymerase sigma-70 factor, ECF subfamily
MPADDHCAVGGLDTEGWVLGALHPGDAERLMLCHAEGLTQSQIAQRLGLALGTVKTRMFHGLRALKAALAQRGFNG